ncbi:MAG: phosphate signaling complex protein PhoU [Desulfomonile tiedjei]|uniref:Phosphate-specific transport system accessory protein PhoU n=1 Tax=Desulfomonile tiedjei TaxID=2358 RepID=A0A9D6Z441_9BACT|nr:phosphate signaling complex protein PhoU [Desulfomonile tiedjei]
MRIRLYRDAEKLKMRIISLGALVEERFRIACKAIDSRDAQLARKVIDGDIDIDRLEVDIEEDCLKILALHQPVADQLRYIVAILKMNNDLERIGDLAVNIAERAESVIRRCNLTVPFDYSTMFRKTEEMLVRSLDSLVNMDLLLAYEVLSRDDEVDSMKSSIQAQFALEIGKSQGDTESMINLFLVSRHLERIADHATNIAEDVIYMITGEIHRHRGGKVIRGSETWFSSKDKDQAS